ncbi:hypothetical protein SAMN05216312_12213 [Cohnella sp. OV330]|uniref:hypothetical protein n=1 Tax=Cohnella sp. OV330 TaxID=1855288 RepID=UPI0008E2F64C|nr:hypothetical protein [Cohnella sp. OV330]SFB62538.1 hypothetical protein SAMN05216312_12213 [Cohnella sp. OV330]
MPAFTAVLNLLKKVVGVDPTTDTFNIQTMLNDNWDKIDAAMALQAVDGDVRVATTANITLSGLQTVDGVVLAAGDRVLVKNQTTGSQNGIYVAASGAWARAADADTTAKVAAGISVFVRDGAAGGGKTFVMSNTTSVTLGTTAITFADIASGTFAGTVTASRFVSNVPPGTAPLVIASPTLVENLNAKMVGGFTADNFIQTIGTKAGKLTSVTEIPISSSTGMTIASASVSLGNYQILIYMRVTAVTNINVTVQYTDATGAQTLVVAAPQGAAVQSYTLLPVFIAAAPNSTILVNASSSVANAVKISASIVGV